MKKMMLTLTITAMSLPAFAGGHIRMTSPDYSALDSLAEQQYEVGVQQQLNEIQEQLNYQAQQAQQAQQIQAEQAQQAQQIQQQQTLNDLYIELEREKQREAQAAKAENMVQTVDGRYLPLSLLRNRAWITQQQANLRSSNAVVRKQARANLELALP